MITQQDIQEIKQLRADKKSGSQIAKEIGKRKQDVLKIIRQVEGKRKLKSSKIIYTPIKYLKPKQKEKKEKIIKVIRERKLPLTKKEKDFIIKNVRKNESDYRIIKEFSKNKSEKAKKFIKSVKNKVKKEKLKDINKKLGYECKFNYITQHHIGYKFEKNVNYMIFAGITDNEINNIIKDIQNIIKILNVKIPCYQRINYASLEYTIYFNDSSKENSKISTNINGEFGISGIKETIKQITGVIYYLVDLVHQAQSPKEIQIYNVIYVNYDFKYNVKGSIFNG